MFLFAKAKISQAKVIKQILQKFCTILGLKVSMEKSIMFAYKGVEGATEDCVN